MASCKALHSLLSCLSLHGNTPSSVSSRAPLAHVYVSDTYLVFSINAGSKTNESSVHIQSGMFDYFEVTASPSKADDYNHNDESEGQMAGGEFAVSLDLVISALTVFGTGSLDRTVTSLEYDRSTSIFTVTLEDASGGLSTTAIQSSEIEDNELEETLNTLFQNEPIVARTILKSSYLKDAVSELKTAQGADYITLTISNQQVEFRELE